LDPKFVPGELVSVYESSLGVICANKESEKAIQIASNPKANRCRVFLWRVFAVQLIVSSTFSGRLLAWWRQFDVV
jgi:pyridoxine/pyridoxamine 5'-phosphate oxidase